MTRKEISEAAIQYEMDSEEDDIEAQCRMIFDEYVPDEKRTEETNGHTTDAVNEISERNEEIMKKKRTAHENADKPLLPFKKTSNHAQNAMQVKILINLQAV